MNTPESKYPGRGRLLLATLLLAAGLAPPLAASLLAAPPAAAPEVRFYPPGGIFPHQVEVRRGIDGLVLQNGALINRGNEKLELEGASLEVLAAGRVLATREYGASELEKAAKKGAGLEASGMLQAFGFQFRPELLLGAGGKLGATPSLAPGEALLLGHQFIAYAGAADTLRLRFRGKSGGAQVEAAGELAILTEPSAVAYHFPLAGRFFIAAGATSHSHHRWVAAEEFALDIVQIGEGTRTSRGDGRRLQDYYAYGATVLAAAAGKVVKVVDGLAESEQCLRQPGEAFTAYNERVGQMQQALVEQGLDKIPGNLVVIDHGNGEFSHYAHLAKGSAKVKLGDEVKQGQPIALLGNSGNTTEPHLHFQLTDGPDPLYSAGRPCRFANVELPFADWERQLQTGDIVVTH
jgi:murein DD-endopeptidase MepM/ murein hydrolase activator NlpD